VDSKYPTGSDNLEGIKNIRNCKRQDLIRIGLDPKLFPPERLFYWLIKPRNPILCSDDPLARMLIERMLTGEPVQFIYVGGSKPGSPRKLNVFLVFQYEAEGKAYVAGYCPERETNRGFALDLVAPILSDMGGGSPKG
jgi:hypothetical protein